MGYVKKLFFVLTVGIVTGAAVVFVLVRGPGSGREGTSADLSVYDAEPVVGESVAEMTPNQAPAPVAVPSQPVGLSSKPQESAPSAWARLAEKYGPEKTALSAKITSNITSVIDQGMELANTWAKNSGSTNIAEAATREILRSATTQLGLNEAQQQQAAVVIHDLISRRMNAVADLTSAMRAEPEQMMDLLLAGDAFARGLITQEQYDQITLPTRTLLQNLGGFITGQQPGATGIAQLVGDEAAAAQLQTILTPEQQATLTEIAAVANQRMQARRARNNNSGFSIQNGQIPVMDLEKLDQSVASVQKLTEAAKLMTEGMKGLREANPQTGPRP